ncbi:MAG: TolB family protein, partial [Actinomycetota bacterium]
GGFGRLDAPWNLYLVRADESRPIPVLEGLVEPQALAWSPDGRFLAYGGKVAERGAGIWTYEVATRQFRRLADGSFIALAWSPEGSQIAAIRDLMPAGVEPLDTEVLILELRKRLRSGS